jgi:serine/threonine-protein kinase HipA
MAARQNRLTIWMNGQYVGCWEKRAGTESLYYDDAWLSNPVGRALSLSLPFTPGNQKHQGDKVTFYFDNLLPDSSAIRERVAQKFNAYSTAPFDLLAELGRDCVGAIQLLPPDETPVDIEHISATSLDENDVANILRKTTTANLLGQFDDDGELRLSIAGAQEKTALLWHEGQWCLPNGATPTTHILKLPLGLVGNMKADMQESVENEWLCSKILHAFGIPVAECEIGRFEDQKVLVVERFDRRLSDDGNWIIRLPQEDMCQAVGLSPLQKYQSDGGLGISDCMRILDGARDSQKDKKIFFKSQIIFWLLFATDGHGKNFSIRHLANGEYELTPLYDVLSASPIIGPGNGQIAMQKVKMAMAVRGSKSYYVAQQIQRRHFVSHAASVGFTESEANKMIDDVVNLAEVVAEQVYAVLSDEFPRSLADKIINTMLVQTEKLTS